MNLKDKIQPIRLLAYYKIVQGIVELLSAFLLIFVQYSQLLNWILRLTVGILHENPESRLVHFIFKYLPYLSQYQKWGGLILFLVGAYDLVTGIGLFYGKRWAHTILLGVIILGLPYNIYEIFSQFHILKIVSLLVQLVILSVLLKYRFKAKEEQKT